eukprot:evm.model.scf_398.3 EVM.evm.TU.scf_398.3   scf_398:17077-19945(-)
MEGNVSVPPQALGEILHALHKQRIDLVKISNRLSEAPRGLSDLLHLSRSFVTQLSKFLEDGSELSEAVKIQLLEAEGFPGAVERLGFNRLFSDTATVKEQLRLADGYQPYLVSPEDGLRALFDKAVDLLGPPVNDLVDNVHLTVAQAAEAAVSRACEVPGIGPHARPLIRLPNFVEAILPVVLSALLELRSEARMVALSVVEMEKSFISCSFFRYMTFQRIRSAQQRADEDEGEDSGEEGSGGKPRPLKNRKNGGGGEEDDFADDAASDNSSGEGGGTPRSSAVYTSADLYFGMSGYLQKSSSHSRHKTVKAEATLWQRRFFGVREELKLLEYYGSEESFLKGIKPRGQVPLTDCVVEETDGGGLPKGTLAKSVETLDRAGAPISLLLRIRHKNPRVNLYKNSHDLILRAENAADKFRWLQYLKQICSDPRSGAMVSSGWAKGKKDKVPPPVEVPGTVYEDEEGYESYADPMLASHGLGSAIFWSHICRDENNSLLPSPGLFLDEGLEIKQDLALRQHTRDMRAYTKLVCETLVMTVPKVVVHCLVDKARTKLGPVIEEHILGMATDVREVLLQEAPDIVEYRERVRQLLHDVSEAEDTVKDVQKTRQAAAREGKNLGDVMLSVKVIELAQMINQLRPDADGLTRRYSLKEELLWELDTVWGECGRNWIIVRPVCSALGTLKFGGLRCPDLVLRNNATVGMPK